MTALEDRLRGDLPALADALIEAESAPADAAYPRSSHASRPGRDRPRHRDRTSRTRRRVLLGAVAAAAMIVAGVTLTMDRSSRSTVDATDLVRAPDSFGAWRPIPPAPIPPRAHPVSAWTGSEALFWAGSTVDRGFAYSDAAAFDPVTETWREVDAPGWGHPGLTAVVLDGELYGVAKGSGARYDFDRREWDELPQVEGMFFAGVVATDDAIWALGPPATNPEGQPDLAIAQYDPDDDAWVHGPVYETSDETAAVVQSLGNLEQPVVWTGSRIVVWGDQHGVAFDPASETWTVLPALRPPTGEIVASHAVPSDDGLHVLVQLEDGDDHAIGLARWTDAAQWQWIDQRVPSVDLDTSTVAVGGEWIVVLPDDGAPVTIHAPSGEWHRHEDARLHGAQGVGTVWTGSQLVVWGGGTGDHAGNDLGVGLIWTPPPSA